MRVEGECLGNPVVISFDEESGMLRVVSVDGVNVLLSVRVSSDTLLLLNGRELSWPGGSMRVPRDRVNQREAVRIVRAVNSARATPAVAQLEGPLGSVRVRAKRGTAAELSMRANRIAENVETFAWLVLVAGVAGGGILAWTKVTSCSSEYSCTTSRPFIGVGLGVAAASAFQAAIVLMIAAYIQARTAIYNAEGTHPPATPYDPDS